MANKHNDEAEQLIDAYYKGLIAKYKDGVNKKTGREDAIEYAYKHIDYYMHCHEDPEDYESKEEINRRRDGWARLYGYGKYDREFLRIKDALIEEANRFEKISNTAFHKDLINSIRNLAESIE